MQYRNLEQYLRDRPRVVSAAEEAIRRAGLEPYEGSSAAAPNGSRLSEDLPRTSSRAGTTTTSLRVGLRQEWARR